MASDSPFRECTAQKPDGKFCGLPSVPESPFPICFHHAGEILEYMRVVFERSPFADRESMTWVSDMAEVLRRVTFVEDPPEDAVFQPDTPKSRVYYLRVGKLIKIGTTANLHKRLKGYPPDTELLASEPGGYQLESDRLAQFVAHSISLTHREWFHPAKPLMNHIEKIAAAKAA